MTTPLDYAVAAAMLIATWLAVLIAIRYWLKPWYILRRMGTYRDVRKGGTDESE